MKSQVLSVEQMRNLHELGVDTSDASFTWFLDKKTGVVVPELTFAKWKSIKEPFRSINCVPALTIQDMIDLLKNKLFAKRRNAKIQIGFKWLEFSYSTEPYITNSIIFDKCESLLEVLYKVLCYCAENGYLNNNKTE